MKFESLRNLISASGGRKAFYCFFIVVIATIMLACQRLTGTEFCSLVALTFGLLSVTNTAEAMQESKARTVPGNLEVTTREGDVNISP